MISDVLFKTIQDIKGYLNNNTYDNVYMGELRKRIESLVKEMEAIRVILDTPPT